MNSNFTQRDRLMFCLFYLIAGALFGWLMLAYLTEPDPFLNRGPQSEEVQ